MGKTAQTYNNSVERIYPKVILDSIIDEQNSSKKGVDVIVDAMKSFLKVEDLNTTLSSPNQTILLDGENHKILMQSESTSITLNGEKNSVNIATDKFTINGKPLPPDEIFNVSLHKNSNLIASISTNMSYDDLQDKDYRLLLLRRTSRSHNRGKGYSIPALSYINTELGLTHPISCIYAKDKISQGLVFTNRNGKMPKINNINILGGIHDKNFFAIWKHDNNAEWVRMSSDTDSADIPLEARPLSKYLYDVPNVLKDSSLGNNMFRIAQTDDIQKTASETGSIPLYKLQFDTRIGYINTLQFGVAVYRVDKDKHVFYRVSNIAKFNVAIRVEKPSKQSLRHEITQDEFDAFASRVKYVGGFYVNIK